MFKIVLLATLAIAGASALQAGQNEAAAEPYSYGYETDTHAASEQRDPSGKVTGYYTIADADGRQRRVEYVADEAGFRAKVQTNEVGTKSENSADVEVLASPPNAEQFAPQPVRQQQQVVTTQQGSYFQQQPASGYYYQPGYGYGYQSGLYGGYGNGVYGGYGAGYGNALYRGYGNTQYGVSGAQYGTQGARYGYVSGVPSGQYGYSFQTGNYNNHLPSQYYRSVSSSVAQPVSTYTTTNTVGGLVQPSTYSVGQSYRSGYQTVGVPQASYQTVGVPPVSYQSVGPVRSSSSSVTSSNVSPNYLVLKKRDAKDVKKN